MTRVGSNEMKRTLLSLDEKRRENKKKKKTGRRPTIFDKYNSREITFLRLNDKESRTYDHQKCRYR